MQIKYIVSRLLSASSSLIRKKGQHDKIARFDRPQRMPPTLIMVVEDDPLNQVIARNVLTSLGYTVVLANNGQEGMETLASANIDLILMDMHMPVMDGPDTTRSIRAQGCCLPVLGFTADTSIEAHQVCLDAGMQDVLTKPIQIDILSKTLDKFLSHDRA